MDRLLRRLLVRCGRVFHCAAQFLVQLFDALLYRTKQLLLESVDHGLDVFGRTADFQLAGFPAPAAFAANGDARLFRWDGFEVVDG
jgi:hypothetical protein